MEEAKEKARRALEDLHFCYVEATEVEDNELKELYYQQLFGGVEVYEATFNENVYWGISTLQYERKED